MDESENTRLLDWLEDREDDMVSLVEALVGAESPSAVPQSQRGPFQILAAELERLSFLVWPVGDSSSPLHLYARPRERRRGAPFQLLLGHMDTVWPLGTLAARPLRRVGDRLYGPGIFDMKAGLAQLVFALRALDAVHATPTVLPVVFVNGDEEIGSRTSRPYIRLLARSACRAFVLEPAFGPGGKLKTARKGVGRFTVVVRGRAAHAGSEPEEGASAILELSHQIQKLFALNDLAPGVTVNVGMIDGGLRPNVVAPRATALVDVRVPDEEGARAVETAIRALRPVEHGLSVEVHGGIGRPPMPAAPANRALFSLASAAAAGLGLAIEEATLVGGGSDANLTSLHTPTLDGLGPVGDGSHAEDEHVIVSRMPERAALLAALLASPAGALSSSPNGRSARFPMTAGTA